MKTIRDAVHGDIQFSADELACIDTQAFQRLRGIKQLGMSYLVFPSAMHSRFEHSLGTCHLAKRLIDFLNQRGFTLSDDERRLAIFAALLHDITHVPFGHTIEDERRLFDRHDQDRARLNYFLTQTDLGDALKQVGMLEPVQRVLGKSDANANPARPIVRDLVSGTVCADLLDYLKRDALFCGIGLGYDERLFHYPSIEAGRFVFSLHKSGSFRRDALSELINLLQMRYVLTERVYYHHAKVVAGAMLSRAVELCLSAELLNQRTLYDLGDETLLARLAGFEAKVDGLSHLLGDLRARKLYRRVYTTSLSAFGGPGINRDEQLALAQRYHFDTAHRQSAEHALADTLGVSPADVIIYCPSPEMSLKEADVPVELEPGLIKPLSALNHPDVSALTEKHRGLWKFMVCLRRDDAINHHHASRLAEQTFGFPNLLNRKNMLSASGDQS